MRIDVQSTAAREFRDLIKNRFSEFNRVTRKSKRRHYTEELRNLIRDGGKAGLSLKELVAASGMSVTGVKFLLRRIKGTSSKSINDLSKVPIILPARRLEVVRDPVQSAPSQGQVVIRLPSGVVIEGVDGSILTPSVLQALVNVEVRHVTSC